MREAGVIPGWTRDVVKGRSRASLLLITGLFLGTNGLLLFLGFLSWLFRVIMLDVVCLGAIRCDWRGGES